VLKTEAVLMDGSETPDVNAVWLRNAVLCADCEVITDSPHDNCRVCGSRSLLNLSSVLGGALPVQRARMVEAIQDFAPKRRMPRARVRRLAASSGGDAC
jgi:hypothetical protein